MADTIKCTRCTFRGNQEDFPRRDNLQYLKTCGPCTEKQRRAAQNKRQDKQEDAPETSKPKRRALGKDTSSRGPPTLPWDAFLTLIADNKDSPFELHAFVNLNEQENFENGKALADVLSKAVWKATGFRFIYKKKKRSEGSDSVEVFTYFCAQNQKEITKQKLTNEPAKRRARMKMERYPCDGYLHITTDSDNLSSACVRITHHCCHTAYTDISMSEEVQELIESKKDWTASKACSYTIWQEILVKKLANELTEKQVYARWAHINENVWRLDNDQVKSSLEILNRVKDVDIDVIELPIEEGISSIAFGFRDILKDYGKEIAEIAMDSTWKTNALGYELYAIVGEANGQALPLAFAFTASIGGTAAPGAKDRMLQKVLQYVVKYCPNITVAHTDKDAVELKSVRIVLPQARSQLCYWHAIKYLEERLAEDKPPAKYDPRKAHYHFDFIDPTWAPGVTSGWLEDGVHEDDAECEKPLDDEHQDDPAPQAPPPTCLPPLFVLLAGEKRIPIWPEPPKIVKSKLPIFCPKEHRGMIVSKFRAHLHQHPEIPINDENKTRLTAEEIYHGAVKDTYEFCYQNNLGQVWAYLWNRWYTPKQWKLWARSAYDMIPRLKTTMMVESLWRNIKHRDLKEFNRPRLDLVTHIVIKNVLPRVTRTLEYVRGLRRIGRAKPLPGWQTDFRKDWVDMSHSDEHRLVEKQLKWLKAPKKTKGRTERLAELEEEESRPHGDYLTELDRWTCSCPSYLISRFLLCKHLVRKANEVLEDMPLTNLQFFANLRRQYYPPFYVIPGIHDAAVPTQGVEDPENIVIRILGRNLTETRSPRSSSPVRSEHDGAEDIGSPSVEERRQAGNGAVPDSEHAMQGDNSAVLTSVGDGGDSEEDEDGDESEDGERVFLSQAEEQEIQECFRTVMELFKKKTGNHPKMAKRIYEAMNPIKELGSDIRRHKRRRLSQRTWKDSNKNTMYLD